MNRLQTIGQWLLIVGVILVPVVCLAGVFLFTAGTDETWILLGVRGLVEHGYYGAESPYNSVHTTGGLYTVAASLLHVIGGGRIEVIRLLSVASVAGLLYTLYRWARILEIKSPYSWLVAAAPLMVPGTMTLGSLAYGTILVFLLLAIGFLCWGVLESGTWRRRLIVSLLIGTAAATRPECVFALGAPLAAMLLTRGKRSDWIDSLLVLAFGGGVFVSQAYLLVALSVNLSWKPAAYASGNLLAFSLAYIVPRQLAYWSIMQGLMPCLLSVVSTVAWTFARRAVKRSDGVDALLVFGWIATVVWLFQAPIPHLRYLWPGLAAIASVGMLSLALILAKMQNHGWSVLGTGIVLLATGYLDASRGLLLGESDLLTREWSRETRFSHQHGPFRHIRYQRRIVDRVRQIPADQPVATLGQSTAISFLTRRTVVPVETFYKPPDGSDSILWRPPIASPPIRPRWLLTTPYVNCSFDAFMSHRLYDWLKSNCRVAERQGPYVLYEVVGTMPDTPDVFTFDSWEPALP